MPDRLEWAPLVLISPLHELLDVNCAVFDGIANGS